MSETPKLFVHPAHPLAVKQALEGGCSVVVLGGYVWEHDHDPKTGVPTSDLRPHYKKGQEGYPEGGYPDLADVRKKHEAAKPVKETAAETAARLKRDREDLDREIAKLEGQS